MLLIMWIYMKSKSFRKNAVLFFFWLKCTTVHQKQTKVVVNYNIKELGYNTDCFKVSEGN